MPIGIDISGKLCLPIARSKVLLAVSIDKNTTPVEDKRISLIIKPFSFNPLNKILVISGAKIIIARLAKNDRVAVMHKNFCA